MANSITDFVNISWDNVGISVVFAGLGWAVHRFAVPARYTKPSVAFPEESTPSEAYSKAYIARTLTYCTLIGLQESLWFRPSCSGPVIVMSVLTFFIVRYLRPAAQPPNEKLPSSK